MNKILIYGKGEHATSISTDDMDSACRVVESLKKDGWKIVWMVHAFDVCYPRRGYEQDYEQWKTLHG